MALKAATFNHTVNYEVIKKHSLNFFDVKKNSNKFYTLELHKCDNRYRVFTDYGRLGSSSVKQERMTDDLSLASREYESILRSKLKKGYKEVELAQSSTGSDKAKELIDTNHVKVNSIKKEKSKLKKEIQEFVQQIYKEAEQQLNYFARGESTVDKGSPLGKLTVSQINKGRSILQEISNIINTKKLISVADVIDLTNDFYQNIPKAFGSRISADAIAIKTLGDVNEQMQMLKFYEDALQMGDVLFNDNTDKQYEMLKSDIGVLSPRTKMYKELVEYVNSTESRHHGVHLEVKRIFTVKQKNAPLYDSSPGNTKLLFHGTRSANIPSILSTHIKKPNQLHGVYITGAMFGGGIYFADQSTKSSQYACARFGGKVNQADTAFLFVSEVALGNIKEERNAKYYNAPPKGYDSVKGVAGPSLLHNEYIIYNENQHELRYIIEFQPKSRR